MKKIKAILGPDIGRSRIEADGKNMTGVSAIEIRYNVNIDKPEVVLTFNPDEVEVQALEPKITKGKK